MCGIVGLIGTEDAGAVGSMIATLAHRGPDGIRIEKVGPATTLAHARLSIIDLEGGWQPLHAAGSTVIGNGEIYNYLELAEEFGLKGRLATGSDFEPLLHLYALEGPAAFARLRGMYALCLVGNDGRTWLVRDPFGIKPLYWAMRDGGIAFASEPRALAKAGVAPAVFEQVLALNYSVETATAFEGVHRLPPGAVVEVRNGQIHPSPHIVGRGRGPRAAWEGEGSFPQPAALPPSPSPSPPKGGRGVTEAYTLARIDAVLEDSVRVHQRSDVPYGLFLSGGIDSSVIATLMARLNQRPVVAYTCGFDVEAAADERRGAERLARALDLDWRETRFDETDFWRLAPQVAWAMDDPAADYACLPTLKLAEAAKGSLKVVLSGEGGDELFAGYGRYRRALRPRWLGGRPAEPQADALFLPDGGEAALKAWRRAAAVTEGSALQRAQAGDRATWLPDDLLLKLDRCLMAHGLEGRTPFLDREVAALADTLPQGLKLRGRHGKWILRRWLERHAPAAEPWARKQGFTVPVADWIAPRVRDLSPKVASARAVRAVCARPLVEAAFADPRQSDRWWPLLFLALWSAIHLDGATPVEAGEGLWGG